MHDELLRVEGLVKHFPLDRGSSIVAVNGVSFTVGRGETLGLVGESGSGKTTVGRCILRLIEPTAGTIRFDGVDISTIPQSRLRTLRSRMQIVFQEPFASLDPRWSVGRTVEEPLMLQGHLNGAQRTERVKEVLDAVRLEGRYLSRRPADLTTSEQQRVSIARAIATHPALVVLDEPTSALDVSVRAEILDLLVELQNEFGMAYILISHDLTAVERVSHRIAIMYLGRIVEVGATAQILAKQFHPYSRALLSAVLYPDPHRKLDPFVLKGEIPSAINPPDECSLVGRCPIAQEHCKSAFPPLREVEQGHFAACYRSIEFATGTLLGSADDASAASARPAAATYVEAQTTYQRAGS